MKRSISYFLFTAVLVGATTGFGQSLTEFRGRVIAYQPAMRLLQLSSAENSESFVLFATQDDKGTAQSIKVLYKYWVNDKPLPDSMWTGRTEWQFELSRDRLCDEAIKNISEKNSPPTAKAAYQLTGTKSKQHFPLGEELPCYVLKPGGFREARNRLSTSPPPK